MASLDLRWLSQESCYEHVGRLRQALRDLLMVDSAVRRDHSRGLDCLQMLLVVAPGNLSLSVFGEVKCQALRGE
jgi:hypothetical protein